MNSFYASATIILSEISIVLLILFCTMLFFYLRYILGDRKAVSAFTERTKSTEEERKEKFKKLLKNNYNYNEEKLDEAVEKLTNTENTFYKVLTDAYLTKKVTALDNLDKSIEELAASYHNLIPDSGISSEKMTGTITQLNSEIDQLKAENKKLADDLENLNTEMDSTVNEYASAFSSAQNAASASMGEGDKTSKESDASGEDPPSEEPQTSSEPATDSESALKEINLEMDEEPEEQTGSPETAQPSPPVNDSSPTDYATKSAQIALSENNLGSSADTTDTVGKTVSEDTSEDTSDSESSTDNKEMPPPPEDDILDPSRIETTEIEQDKVIEKPQQKETKTGDLINTQETETPTDERSEPKDPLQEKNEPGSDLEDILNEIDLELDASLDEPIDEPIDEFQDEDDSSSELGDALKDVDLSKNIEGPEGGDQLQPAEQQTEDDDETSTQEEKKES